MAEIENDTVIGMVEQIEGQEEEAEQKPGAFFTDKVTTFKIFVKNLAKGTQPSELKAVFATFGRVVECEIFRDETMAFVHMEDELHGRVAVNTINGRTINGRTISVEESNQKYQGPSIPTTRLRVENIPGSMKARDLRNLFIKYGMVISAQITNGEGIVSIEAIADIRSALNEINGLIVDNCTLTVSPILNTSISYMPKLRKPELAPNSYSRGLSLCNRPRMPMYNQKHEVGDMAYASRFHHAPNFYGPRSHGHANFENVDEGPEGRVLRDPYGIRPPPPPPPPRLPATRVPFLPPPLHRQTPMLPRTHSSQVRPKAAITTTIDPLFFKRHEILGTDKSPKDKSVHNYSDTGSCNVNANEQRLDVDTFSGSQYNNFPNSHQTYSNNVNNPRRIPPPIYAPPTRVPIKRSSSPIDAGQAYAVPSMIRPGDFQPPKKFFSNRPNKPKRKKNKADRPQLPIPEEIQRPVPDFSSFYTVPNNAVLKPFPAPPPTQDEDFSDDVQVYTF